MALNAGEIQTEPNDKVVFNSPYVNGASHNLRITNKGQTKIVFRTIIQDAKRVTAQPAYGVLGPFQKTYINLNVAPYDSDSAGHSSESLTIGWTAVTNDVMKGEPRHFQTSGLLRQKHIAFEYNM